MHLAKSTLTHGMPGLTPAVYSTLRKFPPIPEEPDAPIFFHPPDRPSVIYKVSCNPSSRALRLRPKRLQSPRVSLLIVLKHKSVSVPQMTVFHVGFLKFLSPRSLQAHLPARQIINPALHLQRSALQRIPNHRRRRPQQSRLMFRIQLNRLIQTPARFLHRRPQVFVQNADLPRHSVRLHRRLHCATTRMAKH